MYWLIVVFFLANFTVFAEHFEFENATQESLNEWVAINAAEIYALINTNPTVSYPKDIKSQRYSTTSTVWEICDFGSQVDLVKKKSISASSALKTLLEAEGDYDCRIVQHIVIHECFRRLLGDTLFDKIAQVFEEESGKSLVLCGSDRLNPYYHLLSLSYENFYFRPKPGNFGYIYNIKEYAGLHPYGVARGEYLVCTAQRSNFCGGLYIGFGTDFNIGSIGAEQLVLHFKTETIKKPAACDDESHNKKPINPRLKGRLIEIRRALEYQKEEQLKELEESFKERFELEQNCGFQNPPSRFFDIEKLKAIIKLHTH